MPAFEIPHTEAFEVNGMAVLLDQNDGPRHLAGRNFLADQIADALQFRGRKTFKRSKLRLGTARASASQRESHDPKRKRRRDTAPAFRAFSSRSPHGRFFFSAADALSLAGGSIGTRAAEFRQRVGMQ